MGGWTREQEGTRESRQGPDAAREPARAEATAPRRAAAPPLQRGLGNRIAAHQIASQGVHDAGSSLPHAERLDAAFGRHTLRGVRAHFGAAASDSASRLGARAYAFGEDIAFRDPAPNLWTVAHEAAHVVQQRAGVAVPQGLGRAHDVHERHADAVADQVAAGGSAEALLDALPAAGPPGPALQLLTDEQRREKVKQEVLTAIFRQQDVAAVFKKLSGRWFKTRSEILRDIDRCLAQGDYQGALVSVQFWLNNKPNGARRPSVQGLQDALNQHINPWRPPPQQPPLLRQNAVDHDPPPEPLSLIELHLDDESEQEDDDELADVLVGMASALDANEDRHETQSAANDPHKYLTVAAHSDWNEVRAAYKKNRLIYLPELGPKKDGTFDLKQAQQAGAGMNALLALRLRETLLKRDDEDRLKWDGDQHKSLMQAIHDQLGADFKWNYGAGTESATSDIDSNLSGTGTEAVVKLFNASFREKWGREPGSVFDVNVYAHDFLPVQGFAPATNAEFRKRGPNADNAFGFAAFQHESEALERPVKFEVPLDANSGGYRKAMDSERVYALVKTCMDMSATDWGLFKVSNLGAAKKIDERRNDGKTTQFDAQAELFHEVEVIVAARKKAIETRIQKIRTARSEKGFIEPTTKEDIERDDTDLDMRAQNELYSEGLDKVAGLREQLLHAKEQERGAIGAELTDALHQALIFANESYVTGAAVQHVVLDKQMLSSRQKDPLKLTEASKQPKTGRNMKLALTAERYLHSVHEQVGFSFREFNLYADDPATAIGKASKYIYRLGNAAKHVARLTDRPIAGLDKFRELGKHLLALKVTPELAKGANVTLDTALQIVGLSTHDDDLLGEMKALLVHFSAEVLTAFG